MPQIRPITPEDSSAWLALRRALWPEGSESEHRAEIEAFFARTNQPKTTCAENPFSAQLPEESLPPNQEKAGKDSQLPREAGKDSCVSGIEKGISIQEFFEPQAVFLAIDDEGAAIGMAEVSIRPIAEGCRTNRVGYLEGWYVAPDHRRAGVGRLLVEAAETWSRAQGCTEFASDTESNNEASRRAHVALGFEDVGLVRCFRKGL